MERYKKQLPPILEQTQCLYSNSFLDESIIPNQSQCVKLERVQQKYPIHNKKRSNKVAKYIRAAKGIGNVDQHKYFNQSEIFLINQKKMLKQSEDTSCKCIKLWCGFKIKLENKQRMDKNSSK